MNARSSVKWWVMVFLVPAAILLAACQTIATPTTTPPAATPTPEKKGRVVEATMARDVDIAQRPIDPTSTFSPDAVIYVSAKLADAKKGSQIAAKWYSGEDLILTKTLDLDQDYDSVYASFNISRTGDKAWPEGAWRVDLFLDNQLQKSVSFTVKAAAPPATPAAQLTPYQDAALGFSLGYPTDWKVTKLDNGVDIQKPGAVVVLLMVRVVSGTSGTRQELSDSFIEGVKEKAADLEVGKKDESTDANGVRWALTDYTYTESGIKLDNRLFTATKGSRAYFVVAVAPVDSFSKEFDATLGSMVDSVRLQ